MFALCFPFIHETQNPIHNHPQFHWPIHQD
jgi:hypothetical protein